MDDSNPVFLKPWVATQMWVAKALWMGREWLCSKLDLAKTTSLSSILSLIF